MTTSTVLSHEDKLQSVHFDRLTGLFNLNGYFDSMQRNGRRHVHSAIIHFDVDDFKSFNEQYGFVGGNEFLKAIAQELSVVFGNSIIARVGSDHFVVTTARENIEERIAEFQERMRAHTRNMHITVKAGVYLPEANETDNTAMALDRAKLACDHIKHVYDTDICYYDEHLEHSRHFRHSILSGFEQAMAERSIKVYYQPHVRLLTGKRCGYEALARWIDDEHGMISPGVFIPILEDAHLIHKLDLYIIDQVCRDIKYMRDKGVQTLPVSVNLSRLDFYLADIFIEIEKIRKRYNLGAECIHIEVTESALSDETDILTTEIPRFREAGYEVWMDDFGSGYSSLNHLKNYQFDVIKLDMDFLQDFENPRSRLVISTVIRMAKELGIHTLCEGVETEEQYDFLCQLGCEKIQGFLVGRPEPLDYGLVEETAGKEDYDRSISIDGAHIEDGRLDEYYEKIGRINVLADRPFGEDMRILPELAIGIMEEHGDVVDYYYATDKYRSFLKQVGIIDTEDAPLKGFLLEDFDADENYHELTTRAKLSGQEEIKVISVEDSVTSIHMKVVASANERTTYLIMVLSTLDKGTKLPKENTYYKRRKH